MEIPLKSLDCVTWAAFADYAEENRLKTATFAAKTAVALQRLHEAGVDPRAYLTVRVTLRDQGNWNPPVAVFRTLLRLHVNSQWWEPVVRGLGYTPTLWSRVNWGTVQWVSPRQFRRTAAVAVTPVPWAPKCSPADVNVEWMTDRLRAKFFNLVRLRASGIAAKR